MKGSVIYMEGYTEFLLRSIKPWAKLVSGGREINCRCFYCPDSNDSRHGHMYINVDFSNNEPSYFYCQKCHTSGIVNTNKLIEWNIYDSNISLELASYNKKVLKLPQNLKYRDKIIYNINNYIINEDELSRYKLKRINDRLGINLSFKDAIEKKIIINLKDLLDSNRLQYTRNPNIINQLDANFIGFLSYDNAFINMRNLEIGEVYHTIDKRYVNYNVFNKYDNTTKFYIIPNNIDILKPIRIHIAEGPFDILSILYNVNDGILGNDVYAAATGSSYKGILRFILINLKFINIEVHFYPDADIDNSKIISIKDELNLRYINFYIHRNIYQGEKDFGVRKDHIIENIIQV